MSADATPNRQRRKARVGKIARLPFEVRGELNIRIRDGQTGPEILTWLNKRPEVQLRIAQLFAGKPVTSQNLSEWRYGGYREWLASQSHVPAPHEVPSFTSAKGGGGKSGPKEDGC